MAQQAAALSAEVRRLQDVTVDAASLEVRVFALSVAHILVSHPASCTAER
jgi:hypothetical protein